MEFSWSSLAAFCTPVNLLITVLSILIIKYISVLYSGHVFWTRKGVPSAQSLPLLGSGWKVLLRMKSFVEHSEFLYTVHSNARYVGAMDFATPVIVARDPELIKEITVKSFEHFPDHRLFVDENMDPIFGKNVFSLRGDRWREMRTTLSPSFTASKMRFMFDLVSKCSHQFVDYFVNHPEEAAMLETKDALTRYTTDVIATVAFGISVDSLKDRKNDFFIHGKDASKFDSFARLLKFIMFRISPWLSRMLGLTFLSSSSNHFFRTTVSEAVRVREEKGIIRPDMIHLLMQARDKHESGQEKLTIDDIIAQAFIFFLAGFDTSSTLMCFAVHELAVNPDIQEKLREEVLRCADENGEITYESCAKMDYMEMVLSETLRKYPPVVLIDRTCVKSFDMPPATPNHTQSVRIDPGTIVFLPAYGLHHDPKYFPDPEKFDPERFSEENKDSIVPYSYIPFGIGPRKCIGNRFALMETKILIAHLLQKFILKPTKKTVHPIVYSKKAFTLVPATGFWVSLEKRKV